MTMWTVFMIPNNNDDECEYQDDDDVGHEGYSPIGR